MKFNSARFITSALKAEELPCIKLPSGKHAPEIALVGRSNVGKSSLINTLLQNKSLAKTSSTPGKTQRINFFFIDEEALLVDLPGYGYSNAPKEMVQEWSQAIDQYLNERKSLSLVLLLMDIRREPSPEDLMITQWANARNIPFLVVFTKSDKIKKEKLPVIPGAKSMMTFSNQTVHDRKKLIDEINKALAWD